MDKASLRELFPVTKISCISTCRAWAAVDTRVRGDGEIRTRSARLGALHWKEWLRRVRAFAHIAAKADRRGAGEIAVLKNTSEGLSFVAEGFRWQAGDKSSHRSRVPINSTPWRKLDRRGVEVRVARSHDGAFTVDDIERCIDDRTRIVTVVGGRVPQWFCGRPQCHR